MFILIVYCKSVETPSQNHKNKIFSISKILSCHYKKKEKQIKSKESTTHKYLNKRKTCFLLVDTY